MKKLFGFIVFLVLLFASATSVSAGWVSGYYRSNGTYVNGHYRTEPNLYKWDNISFDDDWSDSYNDNSYYRKYGYDPEPFDDDYVSSYSRNSYFNDDYDSYDTYDYETYDYNYYDFDTYDYDYDVDSYDWDW